jgi:hypothetical protein
VVGNPSFSQAYNDPKHKSSNNHANSNLSEEQKKETMTKGKFNKSSL